MTTALTPFILVQYSSARVTVEQGKDKGLVREFSSGELRIGTAVSNDLVLSDPTVSAAHCSLELVPGGVRVRDSESTNGVYVGGIRVYDAFCPAPVEVRLGNTTIVVKMSGSDVSREQAVVTRFGSLVGQSTCMREMFADLARLAPSKLPILLEGETGTGKTEVARCIHDVSDRSGKPFVILDCACIAPGLVEDQLFGHERGAFPGAVNAQPGAFERADGGTIFIDEVGELSPELQMRFLGVLANGRVQRLGANGRERAVDVRVICATNKNLDEELRRKRFREDLHCRINVAKVRVPPLRERKGDLEFLAEHFLNNLQPPRRLSDIPQPIWDMFEKHRWPGNVRELLHDIELFAVLPERVFANKAHVVDREVHKQNFVAPEDLEQTLDDAVGLLPLPQARKVNGANFDMDYYEAVMRAAGQDKHEAARLAGVSLERIGQLRRAVEGAVRGVWKWDVGPSLESKEKTGEVAANKASTMDVSLAPKRSRRRQH